ncbi:MAG TPA: hypothetical protein VN285_04960 [Candidatus Deferrimicrobium sp.]|nr:hypothetical protein [Candidatus Deferrimicrobium sp.]
MFRGDRGAEEEAGQAGMNLFVEISDYLDSTYLNLVHSGLDELQAVCNFTQNMFTERARELREDIKSARNEFDRCESDHNGFYEHQLDQLVAGYRDMTETFPDQVWRSLFMATCGFMESQLTYLCDIVWLLQKKSINEKILRKWYVSDCVKFLQERKVALPEMLSSERERNFLSYIRSACAHHNGYIRPENVTPVREFFEIFRTYPGITIETHSNTVSIRPAFLSIFLLRLRATLGQLVEALLDYGRDPALRVEYEAFVQLLKARKGLVKE